MQRYPHAKSTSFGFPTDRSEIPTASSARAEREGGGLFLVAAVAPYAQLVGIGGILGIVAAAGILRGGVRPCRLLEAAQSS